MIQYYASEDAGLPALTFNSNITLAVFTNFKLILKACLVNGYGAKAAAGWTLVDEGDLFIVLRNSTGKYVTFVCYYQFNATQVQYYSYARVYLHASYTGMSGGIPTGDGVVSGIAAGSSAPQHRGTRFMFQYAATTRWSVVADGATFIFSSVAINGSTAANYVGTALDSGVNTDPACLYVGDDSNGEFIAVGGYSSIPAQYQADSYFRGTDLTVLRNPVTGLLVDTGGVSAEVVGVRVATLGGFTLNTIWDKPRFNLCPATWTCAGKEQGYLRGIGLDPAVYAHYSTAVKNMLDGTNVVHNVQQILVPTTLPDGYKYFPLLANHGQRKSAIITDNPEFW